VSCHWYRSRTGNRAGIVWVGGAGGGWDTPAKGLYPRLARSFQDAGLRSLHIRFRNSLDLKEAVSDVLSGVAFLRTQGVTEVGFVGHSFGGAVVIQAAADTPEAKAVVTLATQSYGTDSVDRLPPDCALLVVHGMIDAVLPVGSSRYVYTRAHEPKHMKIFRGGTHGLDEVAHEVDSLLSDWIMKYLA
jgi:dienelactone hydrolase